MARLSAAKKGSPQGSVISPLLANLFLHYAFDEWMRRNYGSIPFERYADDILVHCKSERQARWIKSVIEKRLKQCRLELNPEKTKIVYCKDAFRQGNYPNEKFDFLGYTFRPRGSKDRYGRFSVNFLPAVSDEAAKSMRRTIRSWRIHRMTDKSIEDLAHIFNPVIRGWINYYGQFYKSALYPILKQLNHALQLWAMRKYKSYAIANAKRSTCLSALQNRWGTCSLTGNLWDSWLVDRSRMNREVHVRICEGLRGKFPWSTRPCKFKHLNLLQI
jgi:group II intron reverse transcriptase/maturase